MLVLSEWYREDLGAVMGPNYEKMLTEVPDDVVFIGVAFQYRTCR